MGNHKKFWLSDMIPNASNWFYTKLKQIGTKTATTTGGSKRKKKKTHHSGSPSAAHHPLSPHSYPFRKSYHFTRQLTTNKTTPTISPESLLVSTKSTTPTSSSLTATTTTSATTSTSVSAGWNSHSLLPTPPPQVQPSTAYYSTPYKTSLNSINNHDENSSDLDNQRDDLVIHMDSTKSFTEFQTITSRERERRSLPPIKTEHHHGKKLKITTRHTTATASPTSNFRQIRNSILKVVVDEQSLLVTPASSPAGRRRFTTGSSPGVRLRINSPRIARIPLGNYYARRRRSFSSSHNYNSITSKKMTTSAPVLSSESLAIVKSSLDPQRDFMESMVEMIVENGINTANDLEDLLACYLSLNADEYHHLIIKVFQQIWLDLKQRQSS